MLHCPVRFHIYTPDDFMQPDVGKTLWRAVLRASRIFDRSPELRVF